MSAGLGEVASIAGILSLAIQSLKIIDDISDFCKAYRSTDHDIQDALKDLEILRQVLIYVELTSKTDLVSSRCPLGLRTVLRDCIVRCRQDLYTWTASVKNLVPENASQLQIFVKRIKVAANADRFTSVGYGALKHCQRINMCLHLVSW